MQGNNKIINNNSNSTKRQRCQNIYCLHSIYDEGKIQRSQMQSIDRERILSKVCFRLPFCTLPATSRTANRTQDAFVAAIEEECCYCSKCGFHMYFEDDDNGEDDEAFTTRNVTLPLTIDWKSITSYVQSNNDSETVGTEYGSTVPSTVATTSDECGLQDDNSTRNTEQQQFHDGEMNYPFHPNDNNVRHESFDTIIKLSSKGRGTTRHTTESITSSNTTTCSTRSTMNHHFQCIYCQFQLRDGWKYCPSCGVYL